MKTIHSIIIIKNFYVFENESDFQLIGHDWKEARCYLYAFNSSDPFLTKIFNDILYNLESTLSILRTIC